MFIGGQSMIPQIPVLDSPAASIPLNESNLFDSHPVIEKLLAPSVKQTPSLSDRLAAARFEMFNAGAGPEELSRCVGLLVEFGELEQKIEAFLAEQHQAHLARLEDKRADAWQACRRCEDAQRASSSEIGALQARANAQGDRLSRARALASAAPAFDTKFPSPQEIAAWAISKAAAKDALAIEEKAFQEVQLQLRIVEGERSTANEKLAEAIKALQAADAALNEYKKKQ